MNKSIILSAIAVTSLGSAAGVLAQGQQPQQPMSFFVTSRTQPAPAISAGSLAPTRSARTSRLPRAPAIARGMRI